MKSEPFPKSPHPVCDLSMLTLESIRPAIFDFGVCRGCAMLLADYIEAGNSLVELTSKKAPRSEQARVGARKTQRRRRVVSYQREHACPDHCPNRLSNAIGASKCAWLLVRRSL